jgi:hypothetical protein
MDYANSEMTLGGLMSKTSKSILLLWILHSAIGFVVPIFQTLISSRNAIESATEFSSFWQGTLNSAVSVVVTCFFALSLSFIWSVRKETSIYQKVALAFTVTLSSMALLCLLGFSGLFLIHSFIHEAELLGGVFMVAWMCVAYFVLLPLSFAAVSGGFLLIGNRIGDSCLLVLDLTSSGFRKATPVQYLLKAIVVVSAIFLGGFCFTLPWMDLGLVSLTLAALGVLTVAVSWRRILRNAGPIVRTAFVVCLCVIGLFLGSFRWSGYQGGNGRYSWCSPQLIDSCEELYSELAGKDYYLPTRLIISLRCLDLKFLPSQSFRPPGRCSGG